MNGCRLMSKCGGRQTFLIQFWNKKLYESTAFWLFKTRTKSLML